MCSLLLVVLVWYSYVIRGMYDTGTGAMAKCRVKCWSEIWRAPIPDNVLQPGSGWKKTYDTIYIYIHICIYLYTDITASFS